MKKVVMALGVAMKMLGNVFVWISGKIERRDSK